MWAIGSDLISEIENVGTPSALLTPSMEVLILGRAHMRVWVYINSQETSIFGQNTEKHLPKRLEEGIFFIS